MYDVGHCMMSPWSNSHSAGLFISCTIPNNNETTNDLKTDPISWYKIATEYYTLSIDCYSD